MKYNKGNVNVKANFFSWNNALMWWTWNTKTCGSGWDGGHFVNISPDKIPVHCVGKFSVP